MSSATTQTIEQLALDGPVGLSVAVALGGALLLFFAWTLRRERQILGRRNVVLFWLLRSLASVTVIWMLLAPVNHRVETSTTRRAVAILTDVSGSMQTVDPSGTSDDVRWALAISRSDDFVATKAADQAMAAIETARRHLLVAADALEQHRPEREVISAATSANVAVGRAKSNVAVVRDSATGRARTIAAGVHARLDDSEFQDFAQLCVALEKGRVPFQRGWREGFPDLEDRLQSVRRSLQLLAQTAAADETKEIATRRPELFHPLDKTSRLARATRFLGTLEDSVTSIREKADVRWTVFDQRSTRLANQQQPQESLANFLQPTNGTSSLNSGTDLSKVLEQLKLETQQQPLAAVIMLTDSAHTESGSNPRKIAAHLNETPIYVVPIGNTRHVRDIDVQSVSAPAVAMRNDEIVIEASLQAYDCEGDVCVVQLLQDGEVLDFREVAFNSSYALRKVRFEQRVSTIGVQKFQLAVPPLNKERIEDNNYGEVEVNVTRSDIKVLLADELPRWEYRYLAQLFRRDAKVECDELLFRPRMIATGRRKDTETFPVTVDQWDQYDVVMLGDVPAERLPIAAQESLTEYVRQRGGTLVLIAGSEAMPQAYVDYPLEEILPVVPVEESEPGDRGYAFHVTEEGKNHHALMIGETEEATRIAWEFVNRYAPLHHLSAWRKPRPSAHTLIAAVPRNGVDEETAKNNNAFLCWQPAGRGRIVYLSGPDTYRLRFLRGDRLHYRFWGQLLRWAIASELAAGTEFVRVRTSKSRYVPGEAVEIIARLADPEGNPVVSADLEAVVTSGEKQHAIPMHPLPGIPGEYQAVTRSLITGMYRVELQGAVVDELQNESQQEMPSAHFTVQADLPRELIDTRCNRALAQQIADVTGGQVLPPTAVEEILELTNFEPIVTERIERRPLWLEWKYLWLVFGCLLTEWGVRKWKGLS